MRLVTLAIAAALVSTAASANSFTNGSFEQNGGAGQLNYGGANQTTLTGWYVPNNGYTFVTNAALAASGTPNSQYGGNISWWSTQNGGVSTITASPDGGFFAAIDGAYEQQPLNQDITGLKIGKTYTTTFYWATAQQNGFDGGTTDNVQVSLGNSAPIKTATRALASHDFAGWYSDTASFVANNTSETLSFFINGTPAGVPPFAFLDGVTFTPDTVATPEPGALALLGFGGLGLVAIARRRK